jgi:hypothetical protein
MNSEKDIREYLHLYLGCECVELWKGSPQKKRYKISSSQIACVQNETIQYIPVLRKLSSMTEEEAKTVLQKLLGPDEIVFASINGNWAACVRDDDDEDNDFIKDDTDRINYTEEADHTNVLSIDKSNHSLAYGTDEEMRFFVEPHVYSQFFNELRKLAFDCDKLIESGLAIDKETVKP